MPCPLPSNQSAINPAGYLEVANPIGYEEVAIEFADSSAHGSEPGQSLETHTVSMFPHAVISWEQGGIVGTMQSFETHTVSMHGTNYPPCMVPTIPPCSQEIFKAYNVVIDSSPMMWLLILL